MSGFRIAPSVLSADFGRLAEEVRAAEQAGADWIHLDVMDGHFVPNLTIGPDLVRAVSRVTSLPRDVHLMVQHPERFVDAFADAGATALGVHVEACLHLHRTLQQIKAKGLRCCVVLNPATPASVLEPVLPLVDQVLVMTVNPGFGGQSFLPETLPKLRRIRAELDALGRPDTDLVVDGGIGPATVEQVASHGANVFVMGNAFFTAPDYKTFVDQIRHQLRNIPEPGSAQES